ncbi:MAG: DUF4199 domain-containing protein [Acidobacteriota bacterium]
MNTTVKTALAIGALCVGWTFVMGVTGWYKHPTMLNLFWVVAVIEIACLIWGLRRTATTLGYWPQVGAGTAASALAGVIVFLGSLVFTTVAFPQYFEEIRAVQAELLRARGMSDADIAATQQIGASLQTPFWQALLGLIGTTVTGFLTSLVVAAFYRKR